MKLLGRKNAATILPIAARRVRRRQIQRGTLPQDLFLRGREAGAGDTVLRIARARTHMRALYTHLREA